MDGFSQDNLAAAFAENRQRLSALAEKRLNPILLKRLSVEDVLSEAYENAAKRLTYFAAHDDVPIYYKLRTMLLQTLRRKKAISGLCSIPNRGGFCYNVGCEIRPAHT